MRKKIFYFVIYITLLGINKTIAQDKVGKNSALYSWFDQQIGQANSGVFNGAEYVEKHVLINEKHKFFKDVKFLNGWVRYNHQNYYNLKLKYNIHEDQLLLKHSDLIGTPTLILEKSKVTQFTIGNHNFKLLKVPTTNLIQSKGFYEEIKANNLYVLYKKHEKKISSRTNQSFRYYEFKSNNSYLLYYRNNYHTLTKFNDLIKIFPDFKSQIKEMHQQYKALNKSDQDLYYLKILDKIHELIDQSQSDRL